MSLPAVRVSVATNTSFGRFPTNSAPWAPRLVDSLLIFAPHLAAMLVLMGLSAFFSASEAALFVLTREDRERLASGGASQRIAHTLLSSPERLLTAILFWNLMVNVSYFALASAVGLALERAAGARQATLFSIVALVVLIVFSEMLPKNLSVLWPHRVSSLVSLPLSWATRLLDPFIPLLQTINRVSLRTLFPNFEHEPYLELRDIERAITLSTSDKALALREEVVLQQILSLSELTAEELMRPRLSLTIFPPVVTLDEVRQTPPDSGYLLVSEPDSGELDRAMDLRHIVEGESENLAEQCEPVTYVPWCMTGAATLDVLRATRSGLAGVVNELGETIGVVLMDDVMHMLLAEPATRDTARAALLAIEPLPEGGWRMNGAMTLRRLARFLDLDLPETRSVTVAGMLQEQLEQFPQEGDKVDWGGCRFVIVDSPRPGVVNVDVHLLSGEATDDIESVDEPSAGEGI